MAISFALGFLLGILAILAAEALFLYLIAGWLGRRPASPGKAPPITSDLDAGEPPLVSSVSKQGTVWVLEPEMVPKYSDESPTKVPKELKNKTGIVEVYPVKKYAKIKDRSLSLSDVDGSQAILQLLDCKILAVSGSDFSAKKWAKRYPVRLESENTKIYNGSKTCYIYFETSWEKESWCKALRLASCSDKEKLNWFAQLTEEFHQYLVSLSAEDPTFLKPPTLLSDEATYKSNRIDGSSSRVRDFLKKLKRKSIKNVIESRTTSVPSSTDEHTRSSIEGNSFSSSLKDLIPPSTTTSGKNLVSVIPDSVIGEKTVNGEGSLCWNLLFSRLFFDAIRSSLLNDVIKARIQRTLSNMRTPSYIGSLTCTGLNLGNLPPFIHKIRVSPVDLNEAWTVEIDLEYSGGLELDVETRIEVCEAELEKDIMDPSHAPSSAEGMTQDLLEDIEDYGNLPRSSGSSDLVENRDEVDKVDGLKQWKSTKWTSSYASRWKGALQSVIANQVSQVPLSLAIRIASLRGTLRIHIKPPPSDQLWFGFTSMPDIEWNLDSSIGERKIVSSHVAFLLGNRLKASIRDSLVVPNYESITIPWMSAEKDDWVARKVAPFMWTNQEAMDITDGDSGIGEVSHPIDKFEEIQCGIPQQPPEQSDASQSDSFALVSIDKSLNRSGSEELRKEETQQASSSSSSSSSLSSSQPQDWLILEQDSVQSEDDVKAKRVGSRRKMFDIGKKMGEKLGEKFEEQRRNLGEKKKHFFAEKSRSLVEKMREKQNRDA